MVEHVGVLRQRIPGDPHEEQRTTILARLPRPGRRSSWMSRRRPSRHTFCNGRRYTIMATLRESVGNLVGHILAPGIATISRARHARMFHPDGRTFVARVDAIPSDGPLGAIGRQLEGPALARFSGALWRRGVEHLEVLGAALRFRYGEVVTPETLPSDQDLLFATIVSPFTMPLSPFTTNAHDYWKNRYWAVSPFDAPEVGRVKFRLSPVTSPPPSDLPRDARLASIVSAGLGILHLETRRTFSSSWTPVARVTMQRVADIDQEALRFSAFNGGRGIRPRGLVHAMRRPTYAASQRARPTREA